MHVTCDRMCEEIKKSRWSTRWLPPLFSDHQQSNHLVFSQCGMPQGGGKQGPKPRKQHPQGVKKAPSTIPAQVANLDYFAASVVFQGDHRSSQDNNKIDGANSKENAPVEKILVSHQDFRSLKTKVGSMIMLRARASSSTSMYTSPSGITTTPPSSSSLSSSSQISTPPILYLKIWPASSVQKGHVVLHSFWKAVFPTEVNVNRSVHVCKDLTGVCLLDAKQVVFSVPTSTSSYSLDLHSVEFKNYLSILLGNQLAVTPRLPITIPWKGSKIVLHVESVVAATHHQDDVHSKMEETDVNQREDDKKEITSGDGGSDPLLFVYIITPDTKITCVSSSVSPSVNVNRQPSYSKIAFAGYKDEKFGAFVTAKHGLGYNDDIGLSPTFIEHPPRGMLICGPHGAGKSKLMREIAAQFDVYTQEISQEMLLSNYIGSAESEIRRIFMNAASFSPSIILLDDADLFLKNRLMHLSCNYYDCYSSHYCHYNNNYRCDSVEFVS